MDETAKLFTAWIPNAHLRWRRTGRSVVTGSGGAEAIRVLQQQWQRLDLRNGEAQFQWRDVPEDDGP